MNQNNYKIKLLFSKDNISKSDLEESCARIFRNHLQRTDQGNAKLKVKDPDQPDNILFMTLKGPKDELYSCQTILHNNINSEPFDLPSATQIKNDVGEELRKEAYPILAETENRIRRFIQKRMIEIKGFDWFEEIEEELKERVDEWRDENDIASFIDYTLFKDLLTDFIKPVWENKSKVDIDDLKDLLAEAGSIDDVKGNLREKTEEGLWIQVFSDYFSDKEEWDDLKTLLDPEDSTIIRIRNKVMHHRSMCPNELNELKETKEQIFSILDKAKKALEPEEREKAKKKLSKLQKPVIMPLQREQIQQLAQSFKLPQAQVQALASTAQPLTNKQLKNLVETPQPSGELAKVMRQAPQPSEQLLKQMRKAVKVQIKQFDLIKPQMEKMMQDTLRGLSLAKRKTPERQENQEENDDD